MLKRFFEMFKKKEEPETPFNKEIELSKIDKHMNFILRDKLGYINRQINDKIIEANDKKDEIVHELRQLHKAQLMNPNISQREIQIMEGNRENYIKRISHFITNVDIPKNYLETYDYCIRFSEEVEHMSKEVQKNVFVLGHFFENEVKTINKQIGRLEQIMIDIRVMFEQNNIDMLKKVQENIKGITKHMLKIKNLESEIKSHDAEMNIHQEKLDKLKERIETITSGADFRTLESFKNEKEDVEKELKHRFSEFDKLFSDIETALKKYFYRNQDRKILREYFDDSHAALLKDHMLEFAGIISEIKKSVEDNSIDLKDKKKEGTIHALDILSLEFLKDLQTGLSKLEESKRHIQTKITHNSAALNLSEQQYWMTNTEEKIKHHESEKEKLQKEIDRIRDGIEESKNNIQTGLEKLTGEKIIIKDDLDIIENSTGQLTEEAIE